MLRWACERTVSSSFAGRGVVGTCIWIQSRSFSSHKIQQDMYTRSGLDLQYKSHEGDLHPLMIFKSSQVYT